MLKVEASEDGWLQAQAGKEPVEEAAAAASALQRLTLTYTVTGKSQQQRELSDSSRLINIMQTEAIFDFYTNPFVKDPINLNN